jgi:hypothetical protein
MKKCMPIFVIICALCLSFGCKNAKEKCLKECDKIYTACKEKEKELTGECGALHNRCYSKCDIQDLINKNK